PPLPSALNPAIPGEFDRIIAKTLEKDRERRYQAAADLREDLKQLQHATKSGVQPALANPHSALRIPRSALRIARSSRRSWTAIASAAAIVGVAAGMLRYTGRTRAFSERDPVVIADFTNTTGEPVFDDTLKEA